MAAQAVDRLPVGPNWSYEPKYDGFRCLAFRDGPSVRLMSRNRRPLERYFPELVVAMRGSRPPRFVIDGEIVIPDEPFESLQLRLHPAASRVAELAEAHPAVLIAFDLLVDANGESLVGRPFAERRKALRSLVRTAGRGSRIVLAKSTCSVAVARRWLGGQGLDGIVAKRIDHPYRPGRRDMAKYKVWKTIDCVVGGIDRGRGGAVDALLLGLYDEEGRLNYVGQARIQKGGATLARILKPLIGGTGFTGRKPGRKDRWSGKKLDPVPIAPVLVAEVSTDHISGGFMRHGARLARWRDDKTPEECTMDQIP